MLCCFLAAYVVVMGWTPNFVGRLFPFVPPLLLKTAAYRQHLAHTAVLCLYAAHLVTIRWHNASFRKTRAPVSFLALLTAHGLLMLDSCVAVTDPAVTVPEHMMLARSCAVGNAALFAHLICNGQTGKND